MLTEEWSNLWFVSGEAKVKLRNTGIEHLPSEMPSRGDIDGLSGGQGVGDGFKEHPIGAGSYKFISQKPGIEVELEANTDYWRRVPNVKTLIMKSVPEATTRARASRAAKSPPRRQAA